MGTLVLGACSGGNEDGEVGAERAALSSLSAPVLPQVLYGGLPVMKNPRFLGITFADVPHRPRIDEFISRIGGSDYFKRVTGEYGVGTATGRRST
jgi:hypothetical protein